MIINPLANEFSFFWFLSGFIMLVPHFVFTLFLEKRKWFVLRTLIGLAVYAFAAYLTCFTDQWNERYYLLLHLVAALYLAFCSKCSFKMAVYYNTWCIVLYYFIFQLQALTIALLGSSQDLTLGYLCRAVYVVILVILEIIIIRSIQAKDISDFPANHVLIAVLVSLAIIAFNTITFASSPQEGYTRYIFQVFSMLCNVLVMYLQVVGFYSQKRKYESEYIRHMWRVSKKDQELKAEYIDLINHKYHDLKHEIRALRQMDPAGRNEHIDRIEESVDQFGNLFQTDNEVLDAILNDVRRHCEKEKIMFSCIVNCSNIDFIDIVDLGVLLGNMLDNATEAAVKLPEENRVVDLKLLTDENYFRIAEKNTFTGELHITNGDIVSTKPKDGYHGFGTQSMKYIVDKYNGQMAMDVTDNIFSLHIIIPMNRNNI